MSSKLMKFLLYMFFISIANTSYASSSKQLYYCVSEFLRDEYFREMDEVGAEPSLEFISNISVAVVRRLHSIGETIDHGFFRKVKFEDVNVAVRNEFSNSSDLFVAKYTNCLTKYLN